MCDYLLLCSLSALLLPFLHLFDPCEVDFSSSFLIYFLFLTSPVFLSSTFQNFCHKWHRRIFPGVGSDIYFHRCPHRYTEDCRSVTLVAMARTSEATQISVRASRSLFLTDSHGQTRRFETHETQPEDLAPLRFFLFPSLAPPPSQETEGRVYFTSQALKFTFFSLHIQLPL